MQKATLVTIISDQTIQSVQFIKENNGIHNFIFVTTEKMESKGCSDWIIKACGLNEDSITRLKVNEFDLDDIQSKLLTVTDNKNEYLVNITGGTKIMSFGVKDFFEKLGNSKIFYLTGINSTSICLFPTNQKDSFKLNYKISLSEYLNSYGINILNAEKINNLVKESNKTAILYENFTNDKMKFVSVVRDYYQEDKKRKEKGFGIDEISDLDTDLKSIGFIPKTAGKLDKKELEYITGKWLEEYVYNLVKENLGLSDEFIGIGLLLQKDSVANTNNDFDVMFIWNNELYIIECKTSHYVSSKSNLTDYIYKLDALRKDFGIFPKAYIMTLSNLPVRKNELDQIQSRLKFHNIHLLTHQESLIKNQENLQNWLQIFKK